ncbi:hypothetical protein HZB02_06355 [Candidatus Woesearchaeota archaeon]|nr:hypothetical protein [Candidatus Woesearchaeota archaeon]
MITQLQHLGLSKKEAEIYTSLAHRGESSANELAKQTSTNRTVMYNVLQQLINQALVTYIVTGKKRIYSITPPEALLVNVKEKESLAQDVMQTIMKLQPKQAAPHSVQVYEGTGGMRLLFEEIRAAKGLCVLNATGLIFTHLYSAPHIVKDIERHGARVIACDALRKTELANVKNIQVKYLPKNADNYATTFLFQGKMILLVANEKPLLIRIQQQEIYEGYMKDFEILWKKI